VSETSGASGGRAQGRVGTVINGKWQIDARIGVGGMSTVYAATHRNGTRAALKLLHQPLSREETVRTRFLREGYVANSVAHPNVCRVLDDGYTDDGCAYLVLELLEGETMEARRLRLGGAMPLDEVLDVADQSLGALAAAHDKGIVHRDVKPENVFLTLAGQAKLLDFGLARMRDATMEATATGVTIGTPEFMPPEQALAKDDLVDARSDVWGLGAAMFTSLSGKYVHEANTLHEQLIASATRRPRSVLTVAPHVPPAVAKVIDKALELERDDRWRSAGEMQNALRAARGLAPAPPQAQAPFSLPGVVSSRAGVVPSAPIPSSDKTVAMSSPAPMSDGPTLESAVQPRPPLPAPAQGPQAFRQTERLPPGLGGQHTMQMQPTFPGPNAMTPGGGVAAVGGAPPGHLSSGNMPSVPPPPPGGAMQATPNFGSSGSYPFAQMPAPAQEPAPRSGRGAIVASAILMFLVASAALYLYLRGIPHLP
jgi:serine/threonine protein kinase